MTSVVKSEGELDNKNHNTSEENENEPRVSGDGNENEPISRVLENNESSGEANEAVDSDVDKKEESRVFEVKNERASSPSFVQFDLQNDPFAFRDDVSDEAKGDDKCDSDTKGEVYNTLLSEFDDYVANEKHGAIEGTSRALRYGFEVGDIVWGKVKSHPWWPGHIFNEAFASSSVRRTRREGHVLVAFFGDSSYGWFDPAELIPFDPNFAEKSQQTNSRTFVKAVEEAVDEASRRCGLGLACRCRNKYNFRPGNMKGYFEVDVPDYEGRGVYSEKQIKKAQERFQPAETLAFIKQVASAPKEYDRSNIEFFKNKATVFTFRKAMFEEFDETYAQAFGVQSKRSSNDPSFTSTQPVKAPTKAPLSGPLVIAEALGGGKGSKKAVKVKDQSKKDRYLIKRRDEPVDSKTVHMGQRQASSPDLATYEGGPAVTTDYVLQKRDATPISAKDEHSGIVSNESREQSQNSVADAVTLGQDDTVDTNSSHSVENDGLQGDKMEATVVDTTTNQLDILLKRMPLGVTEVASSSLQQEGETMVGISRLNEGSIQTDSVSVRAERDSVVDTSLDTQTGSHLEATHSIGTGAEVEVKKKKKKTNVLKRQSLDLSSEDLKVKKKKKKKEPSSETSPDRPKKKSSAKGTSGSLGGDATGISTVVGPLPREDSQLHHQKKDVGTSNASFGVIGTLPMIGLGIVELDVPLFLSDLHILATDPCRSTEMSSRSTTKQFFLRFRSTVYQKAVVASTLPETESMEICATKSPPSTGVSDHKDLPPSKPVKSTVKPDNAMKGGRKRLPSDRQEEMAARKLKKINQLKTLAAEKKAGQRGFEPQRTEGKDPAAPAPPKVAKSDAVRKMDQPRAVQPTMLIMKFPPETALPSANELKAKFARFGSIDQSAIRVFWQSSTCRVVFRHKLDAQSAYKYAVGNSLFGKDIYVRYSLREVGAPATEVPDSDRVRGDDSSLDTPRVKESTIERPPLAHQPIYQSTGQLKSILKKPTGEEAGLAAGGNGNRGTARVKFMLGGEESGSRGEVGNKNFNDSASIADGGARTSVAMDINTKNFQKVISQPPILPLPTTTTTSTTTKFAKPLLNNVQVATRNTHAPTDISQQMLSLLTRCNDVVTTVTGLLGYVPYHPL